MEKPTKSLTYSDFPCEIVSNSLQTGYTLHGGCIFKSAFTSVVMVMGLYTVYGTRGTEFKKGLKRRPNKLELYRKYLDLKTCEEAFVIRSLQSDHNIHICT